jgi:hypothetical protein
MSPDHPWVLPTTQGIHADNNNAPFPASADPAQILRFLDDDDIDVLKCCSRECSFLTFLYVETRFAKCEARPARDPNDWDSSGFATRGAISPGSGVSWCLNFACSKNAMHVFFRLHVGIRRLPS